MKELLAHNVTSLHMQDAAGHTPLHIAAQHPDSPDLWRTLLEYGADADVAVLNGERKTPLDLANEHGYTLASEMYVEHTMWLKMNSLPAGSVRAKPSTSSGPAELQSFLQCCTFLGNGNGNDPAPKQPPVQRPVHERPLRSSRPASQRPERV